MNDTTSTVTQDRSLGEIIRAHGNLNAENVEAVLAYQRQHGVRFGEAAVALGLVSKGALLAALSEQFNYPVAASTGEQLGHELVVLRQPFTAQAESFRAVRSRLLMLGSEGLGTAVAVVSPDDGDGKSYFAANLACALAQLGRRTLLVDADLRAPRQHQIFSVDNGVGLSGILAGRSSANAIKRVAGVPELCVLPVGGTPPNPLELLERPAFGQLLRELSSGFENVIVDTPAASQGADALVCAARCGHAVVIARRDRSRFAALKALNDGLTFAEVKVAGLIYNEYVA